jgi:transcriptional regulator with XRE-family HTH domain
MSAGDDFPTEEEIERAVRQRADELGPDGVAVFADFGMDLDDWVRFRPLAARCQAAREARGLSLKDAAKQLGVPQYRIRDIETPRPFGVDGEVLERLVAFVDIEPYLARWRARYPDVAARVLPSVLTLRVGLDEIEPPVWRRIQIPSTFDFFELHVALQDAMGWRDTHLHEFEASEPATGRRLLIGLPDDENPEERPTEPGWTTPVAPILTPGASVRYLYDFGDDWSHTVTCEAREPRDAGVRYPRCLDGARACPPEDVGGPPGYMDFLAAVIDPSHEDREAMLQWAGGSWDPERFDRRAIRFSNPKTRLRRYLAG